MTYVINTSRYEKAGASGVELMKAMVSLLPYISFTPRQVERARYGLIRNGISEDRAYRENTS